MRRSDREITDEIIINCFIQNERIIRIAFYDEGDIYIVPVNYGHCMEEGKHIFYFHGAKAGRKYELSLSAPSVGFEIDGDFKILEAGSACDYSAKFQSVIGTGRLSIVEDIAAKINGLNVLMGQLTGQTTWEYDSKMVDGVAVFRLEVDKLSCKAK